MRVALAVGKRMMSTVIGHPGDHRTLHRHTTGNSECPSQTTFGPKRAMGEVPMETNGDTYAADDIEEGEQRHIDPGESPAPGERHRDNQCHQRSDDTDVHRHIDASRTLPVQNRLSTLGGWFR